MKIYLLTSNKYTTKLCPVNIEMLNRYWPGNDITVVGYEGVLKLKNLPDNVTKYCLGNQYAYGKTWTNALIPFFNKQEHEYFILVFDDHILMNEVDVEKIQVLESWISNNKADKAMIGGGISLKQATQISDDVLLFNQEANYRMSLHPAIWTRNYLLQYLKPNYTSWDFEQKNNSLAKYDGGRIINFNYDYPKERHPYSYLELYTKGAINIDKDGNILSHQPSSRFFNKEDLKHIWNKANQENIR